MIDNLTVESLYFALPIWIAFFYSFCQKLCPLFSCQYKRDSYYLLADLMLNVMVLDLQVLCPFRQFITFSNVKRILISNDKMQVVSLVLHYDTIVIFCWRLVINYQSSRLLQILCPGIRRYIFGFSRLICWCSLHCGFFHEQYTIWHEKTARHRFSRVHTPIIVTIGVTCKL